MSEESGGEMAGAGDGAGVALGSADALVLGGGGVGGIAWTVGVINGLADAGCEVRGAGRLIGTSAGSTVAAQLGSAETLEQLYARQVDPDRQAAELMVEIDFETYAGQFTELLAGVTDPLEVRRAVGRWAMNAATVPEAQRRAVIASRLPSPDWPARTITVVTVDAETGEARPLDRDSGVQLTDAIAASCAVPGIWPPVTIAGRRYIDGGMRGGSNADYAAGADRVLICAPLGDRELLPTETPFDQTVAALRAGGSRVAVIAPDERAAQTLAANPLDPSTRVPAAQAGRAQGRAAMLVYA